MDEDDSEWEYEYHETETEEFYVTLDLSSHSKPFGQGIKQPPNITAGRKSTAPPAPSSPTPNLQPEGEDEDAAEESPSKQTPSPSQASHPVDPSITQPQGPKRIQILDLHSRNPLISYNSQLYSCDWTTTLGTDMLFTTVQRDSSLQPAPSSSQQETAQPATAPNQSASLLAATRTRLSAHPVQVVPRAEHPSTSISIAAETPGDVSRAPSTAAPSAMVRDSTAINASRTDTPQSISLGPTLSAKRQNQAAFLTRLAEIKRAKGETDEVPIYADQRGGGRGIAEVANANEEEEEDDEDEALTPPRASPARARIISSRGRGRVRARGRVSRSRGRPRKVSTGAGLFRDHGPSPLGERSAVKRTPERWEDLVGDDEDSDLEMREVEESEVRGKEEVEDWRQRLSEHLQVQRNASVVAANNDDDDVEDERAEDVELVGG